MRKAALVSLAAIALLLVHSAPSEAHVRGGIWIGPIWGPGWWGPAYSTPYYPPYYSAPYYSAPVVIQQEPQQYMAPAPQQQYWYYCSEPQGYYPYVKQCPKGWTKVAPTPAPPETEE